MIKNQYIQSLIQANKLKHIYTNIDFRFKIGAKKQEKKSFNRDMSVESKEMIEEINLIKEMQMHER